MLGVRTDAVPVLEVVASMQLPFGPGVCGLAHCPGTHGDVGRHSARFESVRR